MPSIYSRLEHLQSLFECGKKITAFMKNGEIQQLNGRQCVNLLANSPDAVEHFGGGGPGDGALVDLLNGLLTVERN